MTSDPVKSWTQRLLEFAMTMVVVAIALNWAWVMIKPLVPVIVTTMILVISLVVLRWRRDGGW